MEIFNNLCRACNIEKEKLLNINNSQHVYLKEMLEYCLQTTISSESKFPQFICYDCIKQLEISYRFIKRFHLAQKEFEESYERLQKINIEASDVNPLEDTIEENIEEELDEKVVHVLSDDIVEHTSNFDKFINNSSDTYLPSKKTETIQQLNDFKASRNSPIIEVPSASVISPAICTHCNKTFFTTKALNLHLKLSHKQKIANS